MNNYKSFHLVLFALCLLGFSSCDKYFGDTNLNPNEPNKVPASVILPAAQIELAYLVGGDASRLASIMSQHIDGVTRQFTVIHDYNLQGTDVNSMWSQSYSAILQDLRKVKEAAGTTAPYYVGISQALEAYTIMLVTDLFGNAPYSEICQGFDNLQPKFDTQESIYTAIQSLLDQAIVNFATDGGAITPSSDDLIYGGDATKWSKFAYTLKARAYLHLGLISTSNYTNALNALANGLTAADDASVTFGLATTANAPWYQYNNERQDCEVGDSYVALMNSYNDARVTILGQPMGTNHTLFTPNQAQPLLTFTEHKFIEAESRFQTEGASANTHQAYLDAISSSYSKLGLGSSYATYIGQASVDPGQANLTLSHIMTQKYIALFADPEVYNDWRRTNIPSLTPNSGSTIPVRLPYPDEEIKYNPNNCPTTTNIFTDKVWWDAN